MRIKSIEVKKLFNIFDHKIDLKLDDHITIIHGPNGFGKTVLLQMINAFFSGTYSIFGTYPFAEFALAFDDSSSITITREIPRRSEQEALFEDHSLRDHSLARQQFQNPNPLPLLPALVFNHVSVKGRKSASFKIDLNRANNPDFSIASIERYVPNLDRVGPDRWFHGPTGETLSLAEIMERFAEVLPPQLLRRWTGDEPQWLTAPREALRVRFIQTQRLVSQSTSPRRQLRSTAAIVRYSETLSGLVQSTLAKYAELSQSKDRTFPQRLLMTTWFQSPGEKEEPPGILNRDEIRSKLLDLEKKREALVKAGLLDASTETLRADLDIAEEQRRVLSIYIDDVEQKLHVFDETAAKIDLFKKIISKLFKYKHLAIDRTRGFAFSTDENTPLSLTSLSSGEQNEVVLLASLLLNDQPASLFLIDEPEISLHVFWQKQFLRDLVDITSLLKIDVVIATHSPQIISDRWDLTIQLKGPDDPRPEL